MLTISLCATFRVDVCVCLPNLSYIYTSSTCHTGKYNSHKNMITFVNRNVLFWNANPFWCGLSDFLSSLTWIAHSSRINWTISPHCSFLACLLMTMSIQLPLLTPPLHPLLPTDSLWYLNAALYLSNMAAPFVQIVSAPPECMRFCFLISFCVCLNERMGLRDSLSLMFFADSAKSAFSLKRRNLPVMAAVSDYRLTGTNPYKNDLLLRRLLRRMGR